MVFDTTFKVIIVGDPGVGKTTFVKKYAKRIYPSDFQMPIGVDFFTSTVKIDGRVIKLQLWDFGEKKRFFLSTYCKGANGAFLLYDTTNDRSFEHLPEYIQIVRENVGSIPIMLIGAKKDLEEFRAVPREDGLLTAEKYKLASFIELSSKTGENVEEAFIALIRLMTER